MLNPKETELLWDMLKVLFISTIFVLLIKLIFWILNWLI